MVTRRIDVLPARRPALQTLRGAVLASDLDPELQAISQRTSEEIGAPMAAVSLVLERVQFFRGHYGLPPELAAARATDRDLSICQFVVRDQAMVEIMDAARDERVPRDLVDRYGVRSYIGAPITIDGEVVGAMCAVDTMPREFTSEQRAAVTRSAAAASARLSVLAAQPDRCARVLHDEAVRPAFGELRNRLTPLLGNVSLMEIAITELAALQRVARHVALTGQGTHLDMLTRGDEMIADLRAFLSEIATDIEGVQRGVVALERASLLSKEPSSTLDVIDTAQTLAHHRTKLVGGVVLTCECSLHVLAPRALAISALSAALGGVADLMADIGAEGGIELACVHDADAAVLRVRAPLSRRELNEVATNLRLMLGDAEHIVVRVRRDSVELALGARMPVRPANDASADARAQRGISARVGRVA